MCDHNSSLAIFNFFFQEKSKISVRLGKSSHLSETLRTDKTFVQVAAVQPIQYHLPRWCTEAALDWQIHMRCKTSKNL